MKSLAIIFFIFECLDIFLNKSENLQGLILSYAKKWQKSPFLFLITQFNFLFLSFFIFCLNLKSPILITLYFLYLFDSLCKAYFCAKISKGELNDDIKFFLSNEVKIPFQTRFIFSLSVTFLFYLGL
ncbi:hypothetical protein [Campylobacter ureolyticus]|mgnify:FL=1|uniref:hypothetical protein n=1 Tax=Campylobacter ureolyticus TaxID=827 RepID=UPI0022B45055|nr:hypothetical protein [Campylobacter ureolyticus]MCZ6133300.1 hypothetical protein [Campylobacter ureolyticus]MCZ6171926.1 hypothetical protein [Campylobacter ureolyticus]